MVWAIVPVVIAILFSFNDGRSRSVWQGFSTRWYWGDPDQSILHDPSMRGALEQSLKLAGLDMLIAVPLGVGLAIGLTRWRGYGARPVNFLMLFPLVTPEIVMAVSLLLVFVTLYKIQLGTTAQVLGQVTFSISYVVLVVRSRLLSVGKEYEEAARDLGASALGALRLVLLPLLAPAIFASLMVVFALSIDDFVVTDYLSSNASTQTVPIKIYSGVRGTTTPALNALATVMVFTTLDRGRPGRARLPAVQRVAARRERIRGARHRGARGMTVHDGAIDLVELRKGFGDVAAVDGIDLQIEPRRVLLAARPVGLRQDDDASSDRRVRTARQRQDPARRGRHGGDAAAQAEGQHRLPELRALPAPRRLRQRRVRAAPAACEAAGDARARAGRCSKRSGSAGSESDARRSSRVVSSNASRSRGHSSSTRRSCCSTSRSARWTRSCARPCRSS